MVAGMGSVTLGAEPLELTLPVLINVGIESATVDSSTYDDDCSQRNMSKPKGPNIRGRMILQKAQGYSTPPQVRQAGLIYMNLSGVSYLPDLYSSDYPS